MEYRRHEEIRLDGVRPNYPNMKRDGYIPVLHLYTVKSSRGGIESYAVIYWDRGSGTTETSSSSDYRKTVHYTAASSVTKQAIRNQHAEVFANVEAIIAEVRAHYANLYVVDEDVVLKVAYELSKKKGADAIPTADLVRMTREAAKIIMRDEGWPGSI